MLFLMNSKLKKLLKKCNELSEKNEEEIIKQIQTEKNDILNNDTEKDLVIILMK
jgi:hypothetical protein